MDLFEDIDDLTPIQHNGFCWVKRDDLFSFGEATGGKARACAALARARLPAAMLGLITASHRQSPQAQIVAAVAARLRVPCRVHLPTGPSASADAARALGAQVFRHTPGHSSVIAARAKADAEQCGALLVPFGMESGHGVAATARQAANVPDAVQRVVVPVGSGMSLAGILHGLAAARRASVPVVGVVVGADPERRLDRWAPAGWRDQVTLAHAGVPYGQHVEADFHGTPLDPVYEAKVLPWLQPGDLLWVVGHRAAAPTTGS